MKHLVLVGFMGTGKSTVGRIAARSLGFRFVDTDTAVERRAGRPIAEIFRLEGEEAFRLQEEAAIQRICDRRWPQVIATGGGCLARAANVEALRRSGVLICLTARPEVILRRVGSLESRPLLAGAPDPLARVQELLEARRGLYSQAEVELDTSDLTLREAADRAIDLWRQRLGHASG